MASIKNALILSCKKATELIEKKNLAGLDPMQNMQLSLHLMMCKACKEYEKQSTILDQLISMNMKNNIQKMQEKSHLDSELKKSIHDYIRKKTEDSKKK